MDTVAAAAHQDYPRDRFQVFVLDDAADDKLQKAVFAFNASVHTSRDGYLDVVYSARTKTPGKRHYYKSGNLHHGLAMTESTYGSSEYFAALDADMISARDWLSRTVPHLIKNHNVALVSPPHLFYNILDKDMLSQDSNAFSQILEPARDVYGCSQCSGSGYLMRRSALDSIGGWPLANIGEDVLCSFMLQERGWRTKYIPDQVQFGLAPESFQSYISQRIRWVSGVLAATMINEDCRNTDVGADQRQLDDWEAFPHVPPIRWARRQAHRDSTCVCRFKLFESVQLASGPCIFDLSSRMSGSTSDQRDRCGGARSPH